MVRSRTLLTQPHTGYDAVAVAPDGATLLVCRQTWPEGYEAECSVARPEGAIAAALDQVDLASGRATALPVKLEGCPGLHWAAPSAGRAVVLRGKGAPGPAAWEAYDHDVSGDVRAEVVEWKTGQILFTAPAARLLRSALSSDGRRLAVLTESPAANTSEDAPRRLSVYEVAGGKTLLEVDLSPGAEPADLALSADGTLVATANADGRVGLWQVGASPARSGAFAAHGAAVTALLFTDDGELLLTGGNDRRVHAWSVKAVQGALAPGR